MTYWFKTRWFKTFRIKSKAKGMIPKQMISKKLFGFSLRNLAVAYFQNNLASIRSFEGCNVAWFTVYEKKIKAQSLFVPTPFVRFSSPKLS